SYSLSVSMSSVILRSLISRYVAPRDLHSFPTRRSSDLVRSKSGRLDCREKSGAASTNTVLLGTRRGAWRAGYGPWRCHLRRVRRALAVGRRPDAPLLERLRRVLEEWERAAARLPEAGHQCRHRSARWSATTRRRHDSNPGGGRSCSAHTSISVAMGP